MRAAGGYQRCPTSPRARHVPCDAGGFEEVTKWTKEVVGGSFAAVDCGDAQVRRTTVEQAVAAAKIECMM